VLEQTREDARTELGASPRAGLMLLKAAKANAALEGRDHALTDDVQKLAPSVLTHRLLLAADAAGSERADVVRDALERVPAL
jgi:MoxR-like ATPase